jgi:hypothetical protein
MAKPTSTLQSQIGGNLFCGALCVTLILVPLTMQDAHLATLLERGAPSTLAFAFGALTTLTSLAICVVIGGLREGAQQTPAHSMESE